MEHDGDSEYDGDAEHDRDDGFELSSFRVVVGAIRWSLARLMIDVMCSLDCSEVNLLDFRGQMTHSLGIVLILADLSLP